MKKNHWLDKKEKAIRSNAATIKDTDFEGTVEHCYMCGFDYIHPHGAVAGLGKCHDCFMLLWRNTMDQPEDSDY